MKNKNILLLVVLIVFMTGCQQPLPVNGKYQLTKWCADDDVCSNKANLLEYESTIGFKTYYSDNVIENGDYIKVIDYQLFLLKLNETKNFEGFVVQNNVAYLIPQIRYSRAYSKDDIDLYDHIEISNYNTKVISKCKYEYKSSSDRTVKSICEISKDALTIMTSGSFWLTVHGKVNSSEDIEHTFYVKDNYLDYTKSFLKNVNNNSFLTAKEQKILDQKEEKEKLERERLREEEKNKLDRLIREQKNHIERSKREEKYRKERLKRKKKVKRYFIKDKNYKKPKRKKVYIRSGKDIDFFDSLEQSVDPVDLEKK